MPRLFCSSLVLLWCVVGSPVRAEDPPAPLRVFYTGHSFHMFVPPQMAVAVKAGGVKEYQLAGTQSLGGSRVQQHWELPEAKNLAKKALEGGKVDVFTMAPNVQMPDDGIDRYVELGLKHNPKMRFLVQHSWVPGDFLQKRITKNSERDEMGQMKLFADLGKWRGQIETQVLALNEKAGREAVHIVPAGDAVYRLRDLARKGKVPGFTRESELFTDVTGHGKPAILMLTTYCNYACLTGRSPIGLKLKDPAISDELDALLQRLAWETVTAYPFSGVKEK